MDLSDSIGVFCDLETGEPVSILFRDEQYGIVAVSAHRWFLINKHGKKTEIEPLPIERRYCDKNKI
jgi:hypothetical protein